MDAQSYLKGVNSKPNINISVHLTDIENLNAEMSDIKTSSNEAKYRIFTIGTVNHFITEEQTERIFETIEPKIYDETFAELEEKYLSERVRRKHLEEELELLKERLREVV